MTDSDRLYERDRHSYTVRDVGVAESRHCVAPM
jgi:hypothetical protein